MPHPISLPSVSGKPGVLVDFGSIVKSVEQNFGGVNENKPIEYGAVYNQVIDQTKHQNLRGPEVSTVTPSQPVESEGMSMA